MNPTERTETAKAGQQKTARAPAQSGRLLSVVRGSDERSLHLSPILQKIKDDGPALIDGEVVREVGAAPKLAKPALAAAATVGAPVVAAAPQPLLADKHVKILMGFCVALTLGLGASLYISWQQQQRLANVEYLLETLVMTTTR